MCFLHDRRGRCILFSRCFCFVVLSCFLVITLLLGASGTACSAVAVVVVSVESVESVEVDIFEWVPEHSTGIRQNEKETERGTTAEEHTCAVWKFNIDATSATQQRARQLSDSRFFFFLGVVQSWRQIEKCHAFQKTMVRQNTNSGNWPRAENPFAFEFWI